MSIIDKLGITPGPWINNVYYECIQTNHGDLKVICRHSVNYDNANNYRLIAAAPKMLEALSEIIDASENGGYSYRVRNARTSGKMIIERATGKTWDEIKELIE